MMVLAGDIGGTKTLLQIAEVEYGNYKNIFEKKLDSHAYQHLTPMVLEFLKEARTQLSFNIDNACFGIAGPVKGDKAHVTNLGWSLDALQMANEQGLKSIKMINDFQAIAYAIEVLGKDDLVCLQQGQPTTDGPKVILGAGTGLGEALMVATEGQYDVIASEGGHAGFAPQNNAEIDLLKYLMKQLGHVSIEHVLSGNGLVNIYNFLKASNRELESDAIAEAMKIGDPAAVISSNALSGTDTLCIEALDMFTAIYGRQAGNLGLTCLATNGVYVAGGIAPRIINKLKDGTFMNAFNNNPKMGYLLEAMPVNVIVNAKVGLIGAAVMAGRM